jgi:hypothetical protein
MDITLDQLIVAGVRVVRQLLLAPPDGVGTVSGRWDVLGPNDRMPGEPRDYRLVAASDVELGDGVVDAFDQRYPGIAVDQVRTFVDRLTHSALPGLEGQGGTPVELSRSQPIGQPVVAKHRTDVLPSDDGNSFQARVDTSRCTLVVRQVDGVDAVVARVQGELIRLRSLHAWRDVTVDSWSDDMPGPALVRETYLLPPTHPVALLLARSTAMLVRTIPSETQNTYAFLRPIDRSAVDARKQRPLPKYQQERALGLSPVNRDQNAVDVTVELDPVSRDMTQGRVRRGIRPGDVSLYLPFDARTGPIASIPELVQDVLQAMGDLSFGMSLDALTAAAMDRPDRTVAADYRVVARERYADPRTMNGRMRRQMQTHVDMASRFGLRLRVGDQVLCAKLFLAAATRDVPDGEPALLQLNAALFRPNGFGIALPDGLLRLDPSRREPTIRIGRYFAGRFSMTAHARRQGFVLVRLDTLLNGAGIDLGSRVRRDGRKCVVQEIDRALGQLRDGVDAMPTGMLSAFDIDRKGDDLRSWTVRATASSAYLHALPEPLPRPERRPKRSELT